MTSFIGVSHETEEHATGRHSLRFEMCKPKLTSRGDLGFAQIQFAQQQASVQHVGFEESVGNPARKQRRNEEGTEATEEPTLRANADKSNELKQSDINISSQQVRWGRSVTTENLESKLFFRPPPHLQRTCHFGARRSDSPIVENLRDRI